MKSSHLIATSLNNIELLPGMRQLTQKDLHLDFDIDGRNSQCALVLNTNTIKSDAEELSQEQESPIASLTKIGNHESPKFARSRQRIKTLQIFKQSIQSEKEFKLQSPQLKQSSSKNLFTKHDTAAVQNMVEKAKRDNSKKKKDKTRGLMYINELWALKYEKQTIKAANIEKELNPIDARYLEPIKRKTNLPELNLKSPTLPSPKNTLKSSPFISNKAIHQRFKSDSQVTLHHLIIPKSCKSSKIPITERVQGSINLHEKIMTSPDTEHSNFDSPLFYQRNSSLQYIAPSFNSSRSPKIFNPMSPSNSLSYLPDISPYLQSPAKKTEPIEEEDGPTNTSFHKSQRLSLESIRREGKPQSLSMSTSPKTFKLKKKIPTHINTQFSEEDENEDEYEEGLVVLTQQSSPKFEKIKLKAISDSQKLVVNDILGKCKSERQDTKKIAHDMLGLSKLFKKSTLDQKIRIQQMRKNNVIENCKNVFEARAAKVNNFS